jgi:hypothetical protein
MDVAFRACYKRAATTLLIWQGKRLISDPPLRNFAQAFRAFRQVSETLAPSAFSNKFNSLHTPENHQGGGPRRKLIR